MKTKLTSDASRELFDQLTAVTFYVVDTEFCTDDDGEHHLISIAIVPVIGGRRTKAREEFHRVMKPGAPVDEVTEAIHGFTDADLAGKKPFAYHAKLIAARLSEPDAVFLCHNTIDAHVIKREFERLDERTAAGETGLSGLADFPNMPVLDTQRLVTAIPYPGAAKGAKVSLDKLCDLTGEARTANAHDARSDARATANAFTELLRYVAEHAVFWSFVDLQVAGDGGMTHAAKGPSHIRSRATIRKAMPAEHLAKHIYPMSDPVKAHSPEAERWLDMAYECAELRCPYLRDEAKAAASANAAVLIRPLMDDLPHLTEPGQAGTLLGAVVELLDASTPSAPVIAQRSVLKWWNTTRAAIRASIPCDPVKASTACPACLGKEPCPRDVAYLPVAEIVTLGSRGVIDDRRLRELVSTTKTSPINTWRKHHDDVLAYALWRVATYQFDDGHDEAAYSAVDQGIALNLHTIEPRLTELAGNRLVENGDPDKAFAVAQAVLAQRTTDTAYDDLDDWMLFTQNALYAQQPRARKPISEPRRARPDGHVHPRLYS